MSTSATHNHTWPPWQVPLSTASPVLSIPSRPPFAAASLHGLSLPCISPLGQALDMSHHLWMNRSFLGLRTLRSFLSSMPPSQEPEVHQLLPRDSHLHVHTFLLLPTSLHHFYEAGSSAKPLWPLKLIIVRCSGVPIARCR